MPVYDNKLIRTKTEIYNNRINTNFHEIPEDMLSFLSVISQDSMVNVSSIVIESARTLFSFFKYILNKTKMKKIKQLFI